MESTEYDDSESEARELEGQRESVDESETVEKIKKQCDDFANKFLSLRPEARVLPWDKLCKPEKVAVHDLLLLLKKAYLNMGLTGHEDGRVRSDNHGSMSGNVVDMNILLSGERGSGKTTVLLNARAAIDQREQFFGGDEKAQREHARRRKSHKKANRNIEAHHDAARKLHAKEIACHLEGKVAWLGTVDMEYLPQNANLLTVLLTQIRDSLDGQRQRGADASSCASGRHTAPPRVLDQSDRRDAWMKLDDLITDATPMWEGLAQASDPHKLAEIQIHTAQTSAGFRKRLVEAIGDASQAMAPRGGRVLLVLPIDNGDRNVACVREVVQVLRMIHCPELVCVFAATERDLDEFLETSFSKDLGTDKLQAVGEMDSDVARRQAASARRTVFPPAHRVEVRCVEPDEAIEFVLSESQKQEHGLPLWSLLRDIPIEWAISGRPHEMPSKVANAPSADPLRVPRTLLDLLVLSRRIIGTHTDTWDDRFLCAQVRKYYGEAAGLGSANWFFSAAGAEALRLPVRNLVDLYQSAQYWAKCVVDESDRFERAIELVDQIVRIAMADSQMPQWAFEALDIMMYRNPLHRVCFNMARASWVRMSGFGDAAVAANVDLGELDGLPEREEIVLHDSVLWLSRLEKMRIMLKKTDDKNSVCELPELVSGWLFVLYDLLAARSEIRQFGRHLLVHNTSVRAVADTEHTISIRRSTWEDGRMCFLRMKMDWPTPTFLTFFEVDLVAKHWSAVTQRLFADFGDEMHREERTKLPLRGGEEFLLWVAVAWLDCALAAIDPRQRAFGSSSFDGVGESRATTPFVAFANGADVRKYRGEVLGKIERSYCYYRNIRRRDARDDREYMEHANFTLRPYLIVDWIANLVPLLFCQELFPFQGEDLIGLDKYKIEPWKDRRRENRRLSVLRARAVREAIASAVDDGEIGRDDVDWVAGQWFRLVYAVSTDLAKRTCPLRDHGDESTPRAQPRLPPPVAQA